MHFRQDVLSGLIPDERLRGIIVVVEVLLNRLNELWDATEGPAANVLVRQVAEPAFDRVEPRTRRRVDQCVAAGGEVLVVACRICVSRARRRSGGRPPRGASRSNRRRQSITVFGHTRNRRPVSLIECPCTQCRIILARFLGAVPRPLLQRLPIRL